MVAKCRLSADMSSMSSMEFNPWYWLFLFLYYRVYSLSIVLFLDLEIISVTTFYLVRQFCLFIYLFIYMIKLLYTFLLYKIECFIDFSTTKEINNLTCRLSWNTFCGATRWFLYDSKQFVHLWDILINTQNKFHTVFPCPYIYCVFIIVFLPTIF